MTTGEEQAQLDMYGAKILRLEVEVLDVGERLKDLKAYKKEQVELYSNLKKAIERQENDTTLDDFENKEDDEEPKCPECGSTDVKIEPFTKDAICSGCGTAFIPHTPKSDTRDFDASCPKCNSSHIELDDVCDDVTCLDCDHVFKLQGQEEEDPKEDDLQASYEKRERSTLASMSKDENDDGVQEDHISWITTVPAGDLNFKSHLKEANLATVNEAISRLEGVDGNKGRLRALHGRKKKIEKEAEKVDVDDAVQEDES